MMLRNALASLVIHALIIGSVTAYYFSRPDCETRREVAIPVFVTIESASAPGGQEIESGEAVSGKREEKSGNGEEVSGKREAESGNGEAVSVNGEAESGKREAVSGNGEEGCGKLEEEIGAGNTPALATVSPLFASSAEERAEIRSDPAALDKIVPAYPRSARRKGHEGRVAVEVAVALDGSVSSAGIVSSSGYAELDAAALRAVGTARFSPATIDGVQVADGRLRLVFDFKLEK